MPKTPALQIFCTMKKYRNEICLRKDDRNEGSSDKDCFASEEYRHIMHERVDNVDARALIVEGET